MGGLNRRILIPCDEAEPATVIYATMGGLDDERQERGPAPGVVVRDPENHGSCELQMVRRGGVPILRHLEGDVRIHTSGDVEKGRMIWRRKGDAYYRGKSDYADIAHSMCLRQSTAAYMQHPRMLAMSNGELLVVWAEHASSNVDDENWNWYARVLDPRTMQLSSIITFPAVTSGGVSVNRDETPPAVPAIDVAEDPAHPGRIVAVGIAETENLASTGDELDAVTFTSTDWGRTWQIQAITPEFTQPGAVNDDGYGMAIEYVGSRLALLRHTRTTGLVAWYSNDHGTTWNAGVIGSAQPTLKAGYLDMVATINGMLVAFVCSEGVQQGQMWASATGGASWRAFADPGTGTGNPRAAGMFVDDSGFPGFYQYSANAGGQRPIHTFRAAVRAITFTEVLATTNPFDTGGPAQPEEHAVYDDTTTNDPSIERIHATNWRGRMVLLVYYNDASRRSLSLHFAGQWCDLRYYTLQQNVDSFASWFWLYKPYDAPNTLGASGFAWTLTGGAGTSTLVEGSGWEVADDGALTARYTSPTLATVPAVVRCLVQSLQGGSTAADTVMLQVVDSVSDVRYGIRLSPTGFQVRDVNGAANIGSVIPTDLTVPHEFVFSKSTKNLRQVFWRKVDPEHDGEHAPFNELLASSYALDDATPEATSQVVFFHAAGANAISVWRDIAQQRSATANPGPTPPSIPVVRWDPENAFQLYLAGSGSANGFNTSDKGPLLSDLPMDLADGVCVSFAGAAAIHGDRWDVATRADYARGLILEGGPTRGWGSERPVLNPGETMSLVLDAGVDRKFRFNALAYFGCNVPFLNVQANNADEWLSPPVSLAALPGGGIIGSSYARGEKFRGSPPAPTLGVASIDGNAVTLSIAAGFEMTEHQYRPQGTREWFVVTVPDDSAHGGHVWRVEDNTRDALYLSAAPTGDQMVVGDGLCLYSDRAVLDLSAVTGWGGAAGYRFIRLAIADLNTSGGTYLHLPDPFLKIGRVVPGRMLDLSNPEWGFSVRTQPNVSMLRGAGGQVRARRIGPDLKQWQMTWPPLPPTIHDDRNVLGDTDLWDKLRDVLAATGLGLQSLALVLDGAAIDQDDWARATGNDVALVRLVGAIDARHEAYYPIENCGDDAADVIGTVTSLGGCVWQEES